MLREVADYSDTYISFDSGNQPPFIWSGASNIRSEQPSLGSRMMTEQRLPHKLRTPPF
jgi:hypothetical protein